MVGSVLASHANVICSAVAVKLGNPIILSKLPTIIVNALTESQPSNRESRVGQIAYFQVFRGPRLPQTLITAVYRNEDV